MSKEIPRNPSGRCFKPLGCAPEHTLDESYSFNGDTFFLGTTFSMMASADRLMCFLCPDDPEYDMYEDPIPHVAVYKEMMKNKATFRAPDASYGQEYAALLAQMLDFDRKTRPQVTEVLSKLR
jgi:hypothetical protein